MSHHNISALFGGSSPCEWRKRQNPSDRAYTVVRCALFDQCAGPASRACLTYAIFISTGRVLLHDPVEHPTEEIFRVCETDVGPNGAHRLIAQARKLDTIARGLIT